jgi:hypothetical protein
MTDSVERVETKSKTISETDNHSSALLADVRDTSASKAARGASVMFPNNMPSDWQVKSLVRITPLPGLDNTQATPPESLNRPIGIGEKALRLGQVSAEGVLYTLPGVYHAILRDLDPANWKETGMKILGAGAMGVAMRLALPEAGAVRAIAGTAMAAFFVKDAAAPIVRAWQDVTTQRGDAALHGAAQRMGDGIGSFLVDGYIVGKVGEFTGSMTPRLAERYMPRQWAALEGWKNNYLGPDSTVGVGLAGAIDYVDAKFKALGETLNPSRPEFKDLSAEEIKSSIAASQLALSRETYSNEIYARGLRDRDGRLLGFERSINLLLDGIDPQTVSADSTDGLPARSLSAPAAEAEVEGLHAPSSGKGRGAASRSRGARAENSSGAEKSAGVAEKSARVAEKSAGAAESTNPVADYLNADTMGKLAETIKKERARINDVDAQIGSGLNSSIDVVYLATRSDYKALDPRYGRAQQAMVNLSSQIGDIKHLVKYTSQINMLKAGLVQAHAQNFDAEGKMVARLNRYAAEDLGNYVHKMVEAGIDPAKAMPQDPTPPLMVLSDDQVPSGMNPTTGEMTTIHEGPVTIPAIYGPKGEYVWPVSLVRYPFNDLYTRGFNTAGIYSHEYTHARMNELGMLDMKVRNTRLAAAVDQALGVDGNRFIDLPKDSPEDEKILAEAIKKLGKNLPRDAKISLGPPPPEDMPPLPEQMPLKSVLTNVLKAWAIEIDADLGAAAESGQTACAYMQAVREGGKLSNSTIMSEGLRSKENPLGVEFHPVDKLRPRIQAALIRKLATASDGAPDKLLLDTANALDAYARDAGQRGPIVFASQNHPGQKLSIPESAFDKVIPAVVDVQLETPLPKLEGKTLMDILPDLRSNLHKNEALSNQWVKAIKLGQAPEKLPFDTSEMTITDVFGAGQPALLKLLAAGMNPMKAAEQVNKFSDFFGNKLLDSPVDFDPLKIPLTSQFKIAPVHTAMCLPLMVANQVGAAVYHQYEVRNWMDNNAVQLSAIAGSSMIQDLLGTRQKKQN